MGMGMRYCVHAWDQGFDLLVDMLAAEPMVVLNAAFCELHRKRCPPSEQLLKECSYVRTPFIRTCFASNFLVACPAHQKLADHSILHTPPTEGHFIALLAR